MSIQASIEKLLEVRGYEGDVDNRGDGTMEILAYAKGTTSDAEHFLGPIQKASGWARKLVNLSNEKELAEAKKDAEWQEEYGNLTDEGIQKILDAEAPAQETVVITEGDLEPVIVIAEEDLEPEVVITKEEVAESPAVAEAPIVAPEKPEKTEKPKEGNVSIVQKLFGKKEEVKADTVSTALPSLIPTEAVSFLPKDTVVKAMNEGLDNCVLLRLDYQARGGHISNNRPIRVANVVEDRVFAWDMVEYVREKARMLNEAPEGQSPEVSAQAAARAAQRTFLLRSVMGVRVTEDPVEPINPGFPNAYVVRPMTLDAVATRGNGFPRAVNPQAVPALLEMGFEVVEAGK